MGLNILLSYSVCFVTMCIQSQSCLCLFRLIFFILVFLNSKIHQKDLGQIHVSPLLGQISETTTLFILRHYSCNIPSEVREIFCLMEKEFGPN